MNDRERVLIWAPSGRDSASIASLLRRHRIGVAVCGSVAELCEALAGAGCAVIAQEALDRDNLTILKAQLGNQPAWSDFPVILLAFEPAPGRAPSIAWQALGNVTVLERPTQSRTLLTAVAAALRARRRQYQAEQAIQHRDQFLAMLGHELRNPLAAITLASEAERQRQETNAGAAPDGNCQAVISVIARQSRHLSRLVDALLDVAHVTTGKVILNEAPLDVGRVIENCIEAHASSAREAQLEIVYRPCAEPLRVFGDVVRLEEVLGNLLSNAIAYSTPHGRVELHVRAEAGQCVIEVRDGGIGISPELLPRVFDLFTQADISLDRARGGLGIGLTIVKSLVELHGGRVSAHSPGLGKGSTFSVELPLLDASEEPSAPSSRYRSGAPLSVSVLVVDDNDDLLEMTREVLEGFGCDVSTARDGETGLERLAQLRPTLAFIDIGLPGLDGYALAREARARAPDGPWLVALTGYGQPEDRERALAAGFDRHLTKPVSVNALRRAVEDAQSPRPTPRP